jgi:hypothetical protein
MDPEALVARFASELGWHGLKRTEVRFSPATHGALPVGTVVTCFTTTDPKFFIQINQQEAGVFGQYSVSVVAERYGIRPTDFVTCEFNSNGGAISEAERLSPMFARANFKNPKWRRQFLEQNPTKLLRKNKRRGWKFRLGT